MDKLFNQIIICFLIIISIIFSSEIDNDYLSNGREAFFAAFNESYTPEDIKAASETVISVIKNVPVYISDAVTTVNAPLKYGSPIDDEIKEGESAGVYSVGGGTVLSVGENENIGKYIIIAHGNDAESVYGNLETIIIEPMERVKKGELIATYKPITDKEFYYNFCNL